MTLLPMGGKVFKLKASLKRKTTVGKLLTGVGTTMVLMLALLTASALATSNTFTDHFTTVLGDHLEDDDGAYEITPADKIHRISTSGKDDRSYVRTIAPSYASGDWTYTITFDTRGTGIKQEIVFVGIGSGASSTSATPSPFGEPASAATFRIHQAGFGGRVDMVAIDANGNHIAGTFAILGHIPPHGEYKARVEKVAGDLTFSILETTTEAVILDDVTPVSGTMPIPTFLNDTNSRLYFGSAWPETTYDDMVVELTAPPPTPTPPPTPPTGGDGGSDDDSDSDSDDDSDSGSDDDSDSDSDDDSGSEDSEDSDDESSDDGSDDD